MPANTPTEPRLAGARSSTLQSYPACLQKDTLLRIHHLRFLRMNAKESSVKTVGILQNASRWNVAPRPELPGPALTQLVRHR